MPRAPLLDMAGMKQVAMQMLSALHDLLPRLALQKTL